MRTWSVVHVLKVATLPSSDVATIDTKMKPTTSRTVGAGILLNVLSSRCMVMIRWWTWGGSWTRWRTPWREKQPWIFMACSREQTHLSPPSVLECPLPPKFRLSQLEFYDGTKDPLDHIGAFKTILNLQQTLYEVICKSFFATLKGVVRVWFSKLPVSSIANFEQLSDSFVLHFIKG